MNENKKKSTKKIVTATAVTIGVTALTAMAPLAQVPGVTNHEPNPTIKAAAISKSQVALQYGTLKIAMKGPSGYVYPVGTQVIRQSRDSSNFSGDFYLAMVSNGPSPIGGMQPNVAGAVNSQYVTPTNVVVENVPADNTVIIQNVTEADYNNGGDLTPATQADIVDKTALNAAISKAQRIDSGDTSQYTDESVTALENAFIDGEGVVGDPDATPAQVNSAISTITNAINGLAKKPKPTVDKSFLQATISKAKGLLDNSSKYTAATVATLQTAYNNAVSVNNNGSATQEQVGDANLNLNEAINNLEDTPSQPSTPTVDKTDLQKAISVAQADLNQDTSKYTDDSVQALKNALNSAEQVNNAGNISESQVDDATVNLNDAIKGLQDKPSNPSTPTVNYTALTSAHNSAQSILKGDTSKYTDASLQALKTADSNATQVLNNKNATQSQVDAATSTLDNAVKGLKEKTPSNQNGQTNGNTPTNKNGQVKENGHWYLYKNGVKQTGMQTIPDQHKTVYYNSNGQMQYGQQKINGHWYLFDKATGAMKTGMQSIPEQHKTVYYNSNGQMQYGQQKINGHWYLFDKATGAMKTGMQTIPEQHKTVYYNSNGQMQYGQQKVNGHWYLFDKVTGAMKTGMQPIPEQHKTVYYNFNGQMQYGQQKINGHWYLFDKATGAMKTGMQTIPDQHKTVYYNSNGQMQYGQQKINGHWYLFDKVTGAMKTGLQTIPEQNKTVYYNGQGQMVYGTQKINGKTYHFNLITGAEQ